MRRARRTWIPTNDSRRARSRRRSPMTAGTLAFSSTASNLVYGDGNTPPNTGSLTFDGSDVFAVSRVLFGSTPTPNSCRAHPPAPRSFLSAPRYHRRSRRDGSVLLNVSVPGAGKLRALAQERLLHAVKARRGRAGAASEVRCQREQGRAAAAGAAAGGAAEVSARTSSIWRRSAAACRRRPASRSRGAAIRTLRQSIVVPSARTAEATRHAAKGARHRGARKASRRASRGRRQASADDARMRPRAAAARAVCARARYGRACRPMPWPREAMAERRWRLEHHPSRMPGGQKSNTPIGAGQDRRHRVLGAQPGAADHGGQREHDLAGTVGVQRRELAQLSTVCGATDGRIAWAGPEEFWTISDGRPGQAADPRTHTAPPLARQHAVPFRARRRCVDVRCALAFQTRLLQADARRRVHRPHGMLVRRRSAARKDRSGAFHLRWKGGTLAAEPYPDGHAVEDMRAFEGRLYETVRLAPTDLVSESRWNRRPCI